jgi:D-glycero-D-manno-heptose 1,7-bisphosphate phosphatase
MPHPSRRNLRPIPGTEPSPRALFIDRWGTLLRLPEDGGLPPFDADLFLPGALEALFRAGQAGWRLYLIGNEDAVAYGRATDLDWTAFQTALAAHLRGHGVSIDRLYACLDHPQGKGQHRRDSVFCLPETGVFFHAAQNDGVVLRQSWVIGDSSLELTAGSRAGCRVLAVRTGLALRDGELDIEPELHAASLSSAIALFLKSETYAQA